MSENFRTVHTSTVQAPQSGGELLDLAVTLHIAQAEAELKKQNVWDVRLEAVTKIDAIGNRGARVFPLRSRWETDGEGKRREVWSRVEMETYYDDGHFVSMNTQRGVDDPAWTAECIRIALRHEVKAAV
jgi:hypothetical protein